MTDNIELYAFSGYSESKALGAGFYRFVDDADRAVPQVFPNGFLPRDTNKATDFSIAGGIRGDINEDWTFDLSAVYGKNDYKFGAENTINVSIASDFLNNNPGASDADIAANSGPNDVFSGGQSFQQTTFNADIAGEIDMGLHDTVYLSFGGEYRDEKYELIPGQLESFSCGLSPDNISIPSIVDRQSQPLAAFRRSPVSALNQRLIQVATVLLFISTWKPI